MPKGFKQPPLDLSILDDIVTGVDLAVAWERYTRLFGTVPHGSVKQMSALLELVPDRLTAAEWEKKWNSWTGKAVKS